jgi:hypothetical protein
MQAPPRETNHFAPPHCAPAPAQPAGPHPRCRCPRCRRFRRRRRRRPGGRGYLGTGTPGALPTRRRRCRGQSSVAAGGRRGSRPRRTRLTAPPRARGRCDGRFKGRGGVGGRVGKCVGRGGKHTETEHSHPTAGGLVRQVKEEGGRGDVGVLARSPKGRAHKSTGKDALADPHGSPEEDRVSRPGSAPKAGPQELEVAGGGAAEDAVGGGRGGIGIGVGGCCDTTVRGTRAHARHRSADGGDRKGDGSTRAERWGQH